jgi:hypothetical protein
MVGRAALGDPWIFAGARVTPACAARFLLDYAELLVATRAAGRAGAAGRTKQLLRFWTAGDLLGPDPTSWIRERDPERLFARLAEIAGAERAGPLELARSERGFDAPCTVPKKAAPFAPHDRRRHLECPPQIMENS